MQKVIIQHFIEVIFNMKRHSVALIMMLALLAAVASVVGMKPSLIAAPAHQAASSNQPSVLIENALQQTISHSTLVVRARVFEVAGEWSPDHSQIYSQVTLRIHYILHGELNGAPIIRTVGGVLPGESLSMMASDTPLFVEGEEVILFLRRGTSAYELVRGHDGKYVVQDGQVRHSALLHTEPIDAFYDRLDQFDTSITIPQNWLEEEQRISQTTIVTPFDYVYRGMKWVLDTVEFKVNLNSAQMAGEDGTANDFLNAILNSAATWTNELDAAFTLVYTGPTTTASSAYNGSNDIYFEDRGEFDENGVRRPLAVATVWFYNSTILETDIWINDAYDWDATGSPAWTEIDLESVVLHEMGHWLSLGHDCDNRAVMYYAMMSGTLKRALFENDRNGIAFIYPCTLDGGCNPVPTATPTQHPTATATFAPTATPTETPTATATPAATATTATALITTEEGGVLDYFPEPGSQVLLIAPPGAFYTDTIVSIGPVASTPVSPEPYTPLLSAFHIAAEPAGRGEWDPSFLTSITLTVSYSTTGGRNLPAEAIHLLMFEEETGAWEELACTHQEDANGAHSFTTSIDHSAIFGLFCTDNRLYLPAVTR